LERVEEPGRGGTLFCLPLCPASTASLSWRLA
jgi:hypothetical protein